MLAAEPDRKTLLEAILDCALRLPELDGGGLYWREPEGGYRLAVQRGLSSAFFAKVDRLAADSPQAEMIRQGRLQCNCSPEQAAVPNLGGPSRRHVGGEADGGCATLIHPTEPAPL